MRASNALFVTSLLGLASCTALLGIDDLAVDPTFTDAGADGSIPPDTTPDSSLPPDSQPSPDAACTSTCTTEGATRCAGTDVERCTQTGACLAWAPKASCGTDMICCAGDAGDACIPVSASNCFACGASCVTPTPACLSAPKRCGCNVSVCAGQRQGCDTTTGNCAACAALAASTTDLYVDSAGFVGATGTEGCPFKTITSALAAALARPLVTTVHVAAGTYSAATGETFPIRVRGVALVGAGSDKTILQGQGLYDHTSEGGQFAAALQVGLVIGAHDKKSTVRALAVRPVTPATTSNELSQGILCDRGSYTTPGFPMAIPAPNSFLENVLVDRGFPLSLAVTTTSTSLVVLGYESGCNLKVTGTTFAGGPGNAIWALGAGRDNSNGQSEYYTGLTFGDDAQAKNVITGYGVGQVGIVGWDGVRSLIVANSVFQGLGYGMAVTQHASADSAAIINYYEIRTSTFSKELQVGIRFDNAARIAKLEDNSFTDIHGATGGAIALQFGLDNITPSGASTAGVMRARRNKFIGNDTGISYEYSRTVSDIAIERLQDWGTAADPGANVFRCNSASGANAHGADVRIQPASSSPMSFAGNFWDRATPNVLGFAAPETAPNGTDIAYRSGSALTPIVTGAQAATDACPATGTP